MEQRSIGTFFFAKYDNNGNYVWAKNVGGVSHDIGKSIKADASGNVYITGYFNVVTDFDPGPGTATLIAVSTYTLDSDVFFAKYDSNGNYIWAKSIGSPNQSDSGNSIAVDGSGNVYIGGNFSGTADFDPSSGTATITGASVLENPFIAKYNSSGNYIWARSTDTHTSTSSIHAVCNSMALDASNNVYITGNFEGKLLDFDTGTGTNFLSSETSSGMHGSTVFWGTDIYFAKYDNNGNYVWAHKLSRNNNNNNNLDHDSKSIAVSASGHVHITGHFVTSTPTTLDFDPGSGTATIAATGGGDIFFAKYNSCPSPVIVASSGSICPGQTYSMTISGANTYSVNGAAASVYTFSPVSSTVYSVTGTNSLACSSANPITATITVASSPSITASNGTICSGGVYTITVGGASTYSINGASTSNFTVNPSTSASYSVTGTGANGCVSGNTAIAAITVYSLPVVSPVSGSICAGETYSMAVSGASTYSVNGASAGNFTFNPQVTTSYNITGTDGNGCVSGNAIATITVHALPFVATNSGGVCIGNVYTLNVSGASSYSVNGISVSSFTVNPSSNTQYSITGQSAAGCVSSNTAVAAVTVYSLPVVSAGSGSLCSGKIYTMPVSGALTYSVNGNAVSTFTFNPIVNTTYSITGTSMQGCVSGNTAVATISVSASPTVSVNNASVCLGNAAVLTAGGADLYSWSTSQAGASISVTPALTSTYAVTGTSNNNGCTHQVIATVTVHSASITVSNATICAGETGILMASGAATYTWSTNENSVGISVNPGVTTTYSVQGTDVNGCMDSKAVTMHVDECTGISESEGKDDHVKIYPNPANEILKVELWNIKNDRIFVYDVCGKELMHLRIENGVAQIDVSALPKGIYFIKVGTRLQKFVKE